LGYAYDYLKPKNYTWVDYYHEVVAEARKRLPGIRFEVGDVFNLSGKYDLVYCSRLLIHLPRFTEAMKSLLSVTKKLCVITVKIGEDRVEKFGKVYFRWFSEKTLREAGDCKIIKHMKYSTVIYAP
jgi:trans-aconitate methyltransferase